MKYLYLALALMLPSTALASWEACFPYVHVVAGVDTHYFWNWNTNSVGSINPDPNPLWRAEGRTWGLTYHDNTGTCQYASLDPLNILRDVHHTMSCTPYNLGSTWGFWCSDNQWYMCPNNIGVPRPMAKCNTSPCYGTNFENGYFTVRSWEGSIGVAERPANAWVGARYQNSDYKPLVCAYYPPNPIFTMDRW